MARSRWHAKAAVAAAALVTVSLVGAMAYGLLGKSGPPRRPMVQQISLIKPPPPPKIEEKPPEPEREEVKLPEPEKAPEPQSSPPPGEQIGVDGKGSANGDSMGLVARPGGRDITTIGADGAGGAGNPYAYYSGLIQQQVQKALMRNPKLRAGSYKVTVKLWLSKEGAVTRAELAGSTGQADVDESIRLALSELPPLREHPPEGMPQPLRLRVTSRL